MSNSEAQQNIPHPIKRREKNRWKMGQLPGFQDEHFAHLSKISREKRIVEKRIPYQVPVVIYFSRIRLTFFKIDFLRQAWTITLNRVINSMRHFFQLGGMEPPPL